MVPNFLGHPVQAVVLGLGLAAQGPDVGLDFTV